MVASVPYDSEVRLDYAAQMGELRNRDTRMISVEEARARILAGLSPTPSEIVSLPAAWQRVAAVDVAARVMQPPADVSAMDGYAVRTADAGLGAALRVIGSAPAGHPFTNPVGPGETVRVFTGSLIPEGADAVLLQEDAIRDDDKVRVQEQVIEGRHIRRRGQDFVAGDIVIPAGRRLTARDIGLAAAANYPWIEVHRRPRVAVLGTGDEIALPGEPIPAGGIVSSNAHALAAVLRAAGAEPYVLPIVADNRSAIAAVADAITHTEMLVTTGGASVGEHDLVVESLSQRGLQVEFWKIAMRPGKPLMYGRLGDVPVLGLPGNPVSALVCAILFLVPAIARLAGQACEPPAITTAVLAAPVGANDHRADHLRATLRLEPDGQAVVTPFPVQDSAMLRRLALADALILRPPHARALPEGATVPVIRLDTLGI
jgi:molybdopterin molybdotransferase